METAFNEDPALGFITVIVQDDVAGKGLSPDNGQLVTITGGEVSPRTGLTGSGTPPVAGQVMFTSVPGTNYQVTVVRYGQTQSQPAVDAATLTFTFTPPTE